MQLPFGMGIGIGQPTSKDHRWSAISVGGGGGRGGNPRSGETVTAAAAAVLRLQPLLTGRRRRVVGRRPRVLMAPRTGAVVYCGQSLGPYLPGEPPAPARAAALPSSATSGRWTMAEG